MKLKVFPFWLGISLILINDSMISSAVAAPEGEAHQNPKIAAIKTAIDDAAPLDPDNFLMRYDGLLNQINGAREGAAPQDVEQLNALQDKLTSLHSLAKAAPRKLNMPRADGLPQAFVDKIEPIETAIDNAPNNPQDFLMKFKGLNDQLTEIRRPESDHAILAKILEVSKRLHESYRQFAGRPAGMGSAMGSGMPSSMSGGMGSAMGAGMAPSAMGSGMPSSAMGGGMGSAAVRP